MTCHTSISALGYQKPTPQASSQPLAGCDTLPPGASCSVNCEPPYIGTGNPEKSFQSVEKRKKQPTAMFKKKNIWMIDIYNHIHQVTCCFCFKVFPTHVLLIVLSKKNRGGSTTATCPDRILGLIPVAVSCLFPEFLWSSFAWCVSEFFFFQMEDCF